MCTLPVVPALPDVPQALKVILRWHKGSDLSVSTRFFCQYGGPAPTAAQLNAFASSVSTFASLDLVGLLDTSSQYSGCEVIDLTSSTAFTGSDGSVHAGTRAGGVLAAGSCVLQNGVVGRRYRGGKPRFYWPFGVASDLATGQTWSTTAVNSFATAINAFFTGVFGAPPGTTTISGLINISYYSGVEPPITLPSGRVKQSAKPRTTALVDSITSLPVNPRVGSQRRRIAA